MQRKDCIGIKLRVEMVVRWKRATKDSQPLISKVMVDQRSTLSVLFSKGRSWTCVPLLRRLLSRIDAVMAAVPITDAG